MAYSVTCQDGRIRHDQPFSTLKAAYYFIEWGHACTAAATHHVTEHDGNPTISDISDAWAAGR